MNNPLNAPNGALKVLFVASEADPFVKVGGLGDVAGSLPLALRMLEPAQTGGPLLDVRLVIPFHGSISLCPDTVRPIATFRVPRGQQTVEAKAFTLEHQGMPVYLISGAPIQQEMPVYSMNTEQDGEKYIFFSLAALELARVLNWQPDILHANDWHTAAAVYALARQKTRDSFFANTQTMLGVHNLPFMGAGTSAALTAYGLPPTEDLDVPDWGRHFPLVMGLASADRIVAVSPSYAREILTPEFGLGLEHLLQTRAGRLSGILNGLDLAAWDPATDPALARNFTSAILAGRPANKRALLKEFDLPGEIETPLLIFIGRMDQQKGVDLAIEALRQSAARPWRAILLGSGDPNLEMACRRLEADFPDRVRAAIRFDPQLSRRMYAGADLLMMPSRYEPCGLAQMIAMRYGCVPLARSVGGLRDTIDASTGFLFDEATPQAMQTALLQALEIFPNQRAWRKLQRHGMRQDFSWQRSAIAYSAVYQTAGKGVTP